MKQIADLGIRDHPFVGKRRRYGIFICPVCSILCEKVIANGQINKTCSMKCRGVMGSKRKYLPLKILKLNGTEYHYLPTHPKATEKGYVRKEFLND